MIKTNKINEKKIENPNINIETTLVENKLQHFTNLDKDEDTDLEEYTKNNIFKEQSNTLGSSIINNLETIDTIVNINNTHDSIDISNNDITDNDTTDNEITLDIEAVHLDNDIEGLDSENLEIDFDNNDELPTLEDFDSESSELEEKIDLIDYKKFSLQKLKSIVLERNLTNDVSKLKKNELLKLLGVVE